MDNAEIVIVGGGIAGSSLATSLARRGRTVVVVEREIGYSDHVRGEFIVMWGVAEARELGLLDVLKQAGGYHAPRAVAYDENNPLDNAESLARDLSTMLPGTPGPMCCGHPAMCAALAAAAETAGATVLRGARNISVTPGEAPQVGFEWNGRRIDLRPRLVIGADGRNSAVRRRLGVEVNSDPPHNLLGGMLVEGVPEWPEDTFSIGTEGDLQYFVFSQGAGRLRLYACWALEHRHRFAGIDRRQKLLDAFGQLTCLRHSALIAKATPIGPFNAFPNQDQWADTPVCAGVVLIGDAAGHNDPVAGQGLSIAFRDVRMVRDVIDGNDLSPSAFAPYVEERKERMRRLRIGARLVATLRAEFGDEARARRARAMKRAFVDGWLSPLPSALIGPEKLPAEAYEDGTIERLLSPS
jgi:2-polyprenyl-6-methoxyphenol hydroxylase-like FAD-dependent oxidoreductase